MDKEILNILNSYKKRINKNSLFYKTVSDHSISIVGTSEHIKDNKYISDINDSDLILRFSTSFDLLGKEHFDFLGRDPDIFYIVPSFLNTYHTKQEEFIEKLKIFNIKQLRFNMNIGYMKTYDGIRFLDKIRPNIDIVYADHAYNASVEILRLFGSKTIEPRGGFQSLIDLLLHNASKISHFGMTYYHGGNNFSRNDSSMCLIPNKYHNNKDCYHDSKVEASVLNILKNTEEYKNIIYTDDVLSEIIKNYK